jgi:hypothetical protein
VVTGERRALVWGLAGAALVFAALVVLQMKGWRYHALAAQGAGLVALGLCALRPGIAKMALLARAALALFALWLWVPATVAAIQSGGVRASGAVERVLASEPPEARVLILDFAPENAFLYPVSQGRMHLSRHYSLWMMPGLTAHASPGDRPPQAAMLETVLDEFRADLVCRPADVILASTQAFGSSSGAHGDTFLEMLERDRATATLLAGQFVREEAADGYQLLRRTAPRPAPTPCPRLR